MSDTNYSSEKIGRGLKTTMDKSVRRIYNNFGRVGEAFINDGRTSGNYKDRTGNLRSSIGYSYGFGGDAPEANITGDRVMSGSIGISKAESVGNALISGEEGNSLVLVGYAGMEYGQDVEARGYDVITSASKRAMRRMKAAIKDIAIIE